MIYMAPIYWVGLPLFHRKNPLWCKSCFDSEIHLTEILAECYNLFPIAGHTIDKWLQFSSYWWQEHRQSGAFKVWSPPPEPLNPTWRRLTSSSTAYQATGITATVLTKRGQESSKWWRGRLLTLKILATALILHFCLQPNHPRCSHSHTESWFARERSPEAVVVASSFFSFSPPGVQRCATPIPRRLLTWFCGASLKAPSSGPFPSEGQEEAEGLGKRSRNFCWLNPCHGGGERWEWGFPLQV